MKLWKNIVWILMLVPVLVTGCIKEDLDDCPNVTIYFSYLADGEENVISQYMDQVDLYVFDASGNLLEKRTYSQDMLGSNIAVPSFKLTPGVRYRVVAVGNPHDYTQVTNIESGDFTNTFIQNPNWGTSAPITTHDDNYLGQKEIMIPSGHHVMHNDTIRLYSSHVDVDIEVCGLPSPAESSQMPVTVSIENANEQTDFNNDINLSAKGTCEPELTYDTTTGVYHTNGLRIFRLDDNGVVQTTTCDQQIVVKNANGSEMARFSLYDFLKTYEQYIDVTKQEAYLPIKICFETSITITLPSWYIEDVVPDWQ